jgi:hypothetical protein
MTRDDWASILDLVAGLPKEARAELIESVAQLEAKYGGVYRLDDDERAALRRSAEDVRHGRFASEEQVEAVFARYRGR